MPRTRSEIDLRTSYEMWARDYLRDLPPEHFMESVAQALEKLILMAALQLMQMRRPDIQPFMELLIQYDFGRPPTRRGVVPDVMAVIHPEPIRATTNYGIPNQPVAPTLVFECVSTESRRKDYEDSFDKYEKELKIPYYLLFYPDNHELTLYRRNRVRYVSVPPDARGRVAIPELEMEVGVQDEWLRVWFRGELMGTTPELQRRIDGVTAERDALRREIAALRAENDRLRSGR